MPKKFSRFLPTSIKRKLLTAVHFFLLFYNHFSSQHQPNQSRLEEGKEQEANE